MGFDITCVDNVDLVRGLMSKKAVAFSQGVVHGIQQGTLLLFAKDRELVTQEIYRVPVPTRAQVAQWRAGANITNKIGRKSKGFNKAGNKPAWRRTNALRTGERYRLNDLSGTIFNEVDYTEGRHNLSWEGAPPESKRKNLGPGALGITRRAPWRADTVAQAGQAAKDKFVAVLKAELNG